jgi:hypothetical protein
MGFFTAFATGALQQTQRMIREEQILADEENRRKTKDAELAAEKARDQLNEKSLKDKALSDSAVTLLTQHGSEGGNKLYEKLKGDPDQLARIGEEWIRVQKLKGKKASPSSYVRGIYNLSFPNRDDASFVKPFAVPEAATPEVMDVDQQTEMSFGERFKRGLGVAELSKEEVLSKTISDPSQREAASRVMAGGQAVAPREYIPSGVEVAEVLSRSQKALLAKELQSVIGVSLLDKYGQLLVGKNRSQFMQGLLENLGDDKKEKKAQIKVIDTLLDQEVFDTSNVNIAKEAVQKLAEVSPDGNIPSNLMNRINKEGLAVVVSELDSTADKPTSGADKTKTELPTGTITQEAFSKLTSEEKDRVHRVGGKGTHNKIPSPLDSTQFIYVPKEQQ